MKAFVRLLREEFVGYNLSKLQKDLLAGITVAAVALPLALAFGVSSGATAAAGMVTAIVAGVVIGGLSGGFYQISGPTGAMAAILMSIAATSGLSGILLATFLAGIFLVLAGILRLGSLTSFIPAPVITGFTSGIAIIIALGQVDNFFGVTSTGHNVIEKLASYQTLGFSMQPTTVAIGGLVVLGMLIYPKKWNQRIPASLVAIVIATAVTMLFQVPVATVGEIPTSLISDERLTLGSIQLASLKEVLVPSISIALLGMIESLLCGASAGRMTGKPLDSNQELVAQGVGNLVLPFLGGIPATAAIARTSVAIKSGAQTRLAGIFHALILLLSMLVLAPVMSQIPMPALAGVLIVTAWRMNEWETITTLVKKKYYTGIALFTVTMVSTVVFDLSLAIVIGVVAGCVFFVAKSAAITITVEEVDWSRIGLPHTDATDNWAVVYISGPLFFMSAEKLQQAFHSLAEKEGIIFSMRGVPSIDLTALDVFADLYQMSQQRQQAILFTSLQPEVAKSLELLWHREEGPEQHDSVAHALHTLNPSDNS